MRHLIAALIELAGLGLLVVGAWSLAPWLGLMIGGGSCIALALVLDR